MTKKISNLFVVPFKVITDMFLFINHPGLYFTHDVLQAKKTWKENVSACLGRLSVKVGSMFYFCSGQMHTGIYNSLTYSGLSFLSPPLTEVFSSLSMIGPIISSSFNLSSSWMISISLTGSTHPSTWIISSSSKAPTKNSYIYISSGFWFDCISSLISTCLGFYLTHIVELCLSLTVPHIYLQLHGNLQIKNFINYSLKFEMAIYSRVMWKMESQALMWERKALPKPWPAWAPFTKPAISTTFRNAGTLLEGKVKEKLRS